jgi:hypothetical protein
MTLSLTRTEKAAVIVAIAIIAVAFFSIGRWTSPKCPQLVSTVTVSDTTKHKDTTSGTTPGLAVTVGVKVKPKTKDTTCDTCTTPLPYPQATDDSLICYCTDTTTKNKTRVIDSTCSMSFPKVKPDDFYKSVKIFEERENIINTVTNTVIKTKNDYRFTVAGFLLGIVVGAGGTIAIVNAVK